MINKLMWSAISSRSSHPLLPGVMLAVGVDMLSGMEIIVMATPVIILDFVVRVACTVDVLTDMWTVLVFDFARAIDVGISDVNGLAGVWTPFEFALSSP